MSKVLRVSLLCALALVMVFSGYAGGKQEKAKTDEPVYIALTAPITGDYAEYGNNFKRSVEMAIDKINAEGGVLGRKLTVLVGDSKGRSQRIGYSGTEMDFGSQDRGADRGFYQYLLSGCSANLRSGRNGSALSYCQPHEVRPGIQVEFQYRRYPGGGTTLHCRLCL